MRLTKITLALLALCITFPAFAQSGADRILGTYNAVGESTGYTARVEFYRNGATYECRIIHLDNPLDEQGNPLTDMYNPDPELRKVRADRIVLVRGLKYNSRKEQWDGGTIYNPIGGKTYDVVISFDTPDRLKVRGYVGSPMFGKNYYWERVN